MVDKSTESSDNQNQPNFFSETVSIFFITLTSMITIYLSLLSLSIFHKFCYFHNVGKDYDGANAILGKIGIIIFSFMLIGPALGAIGAMLGSGSVNFKGSTSFIYLIIVIIKGIFFGQTIPKCLPAFPLSFDFFKNRNHVDKPNLKWERESLFPNQLPPKLNAMFVIDRNWDSTGNPFMGFWKFLTSSFDSSLGMKTIGDKCLMDNNNCSQNGVISGKVDPLVFLGDKYVGRFMINEPNNNK